MLKQSGQPRWRRWPVVLLRRLHDDCGTISISFVLAFPIFLVIVAVFVQYALLVNARTVVQHAAEAAVRAAITSLPDQRPQNVIKAARMALVPLCPAAAGSPDAEADSIADSLRACGANIPASYAQRYTYAVDAASVAWSGGDYEHNEGREVAVTLRYRFRLTVPAAMTFIGRDAEVAGLSGRYFDLVATARAQSSHGRKTHAHGNGWPW